MRVMKSAPPGCALAQPVQSYQVPSMRSLSFLPVSFFFLIKSSGVSSIASGTSTLNGEKSPARAATGDGRATWSFLGRRLHDADPRLTLRVASESPRRETARDATPRRVGAPRVTEMARIDARGAAVEVILANVSTLAGTLTSRRAIRIRR